MKDDNELISRYHLDNTKLDLYQVSESPHSFYITLSSWAANPLGHGRCGCVVMTIGFQKKGAVMFGRAAIKYPHGIDSDGWILANEKAALERIDRAGGHPNIIKLLDWIPRLSVDQEMRSACVLEYVDGWTLLDICMRWARPLWRLMDVIMLRWLIQLGRALEFMHDKACVVHKDLKLHNIMIKHGVNVKLIDFGMSRVVPAGEQVDWQSDMAQLGRVVAQLLSRADADIAAQFEHDNSERGCRTILQTSAAAFWGVKVLPLERLFDGDMSASEFVRFMKPCHVLRLKKQRDAAKQLKLDGPDPLTELGLFLKLGSSKQLRSQEGGAISSAAARL